MYVNINIPVVSSKKVTQSVGLYLVILLARLLANFFMMYKNKLTRIKNFTFFSLCLVIASGSSQVVSPVIIFA